MAEIFDGRIEIRWYCTPLVSRSKPELSKKQGTTRPVGIMLKFFIIIFYSKFCVKSIPKNTHYSQNYSLHFLVIQLYIRTLKQ